jgi:uncharacterized protein (DUF885 family)
LQQELPEIPLFRRKRVFGGLSGFAEGWALYAEHWTRHQAIDYGIPVAEVERYIVMPGQACAYKIDELEILTQRPRSRRRSETMRR